MVTKQTANSFHRCGSVKKIWRELATWYQTPLGQQLLQVEKQQLDAILPTLFGYHLIQVGQIYAENVLGASRVSHCCVMGTGSGDQDGFVGTGKYFDGLPHALPLASESVDVVVLPHTLEFSQQPHAVLREVDRVLVPEGHVVMMVFNPWSLWMLRSLLVGWRHIPPWCGRFISSTRTRDWLALLGFDVTQCQGYFFRPPVQHHGIMGRLHWFEKLGSRLWPVLGGSYVLVAKKRVETLTPIRTRWKPRKRVMAAGLVESMKTHPDKIIHLKTYRRSNGEG